MWNKYRKTRETRKARKTRRKAFAMDYGISRRQPLLSVWQRFANVAGEGSRRRGSERVENNDDLTVVVFVLTVFHVFLGCNHRITVVRRNDVTLFITRHFLMVMINNNNNNNT